MEHDRTWQDAQVAEGLREHWWLHASPAKRVLTSAWFAVWGTATGAGIGWADGSGWLPWTLMGAVFGVLPVLPLWLAPKRFAAWTIRQSFPTDATLRRGASAVQRDGIRTDSAVGTKSPPYWPAPPTDD